MSNGWVKYEKTVVLERLHHRGGHRIGMRFDADEELKQLCRDMAATYTKTHGCWYVDNHRDNMKKIFATFRGKAWVDSTAFFGEKPKKEKVEEKQAKAGIVLDEVAKVELDKFCTYLQAQGKAESSVRSYGNCIAVFLAYFAGRDVATINKDDIDEFLGKHIYTQGSARSTHAQYVAALKHFYRNRYNKYIEVEQLAYPKKGKTLPKVLAKEEIALMIKRTANLTTLEIKLIF